MKLVDVDRWTRAGQSLCELDPKRMLALLEIAERLVEIYRGTPDPEPGEPVPYLVYPTKDGGEFH